MKKEEEEEIDCFWCGRVIKPELMKKEKKYNTIVYVCKDCEQK